MMPFGMIILGASGAGKSTLGRAVAEQLGVSFIELDDFVWRADTEVPFTQMYSREEKIERLTAAANDAGRFVMAGSINSVHAHFDPMFRLAVHLDADAALRVQRVRQRKLMQYGQRILPGGDMYENNERFLKEVAAYDDGTEVCMAAQHRQWLSELACPILRLDGSRPIEENVRIIVSACREHCPELIAAD